jgi:hypothetical protein
LCGGAQGSTNFIGGPTFGAANVDSYNGLGFSVTDVLSISKLKEKLKVFNLIIF